MPPAEGRPPPACGKDAVRFRSCAPTPDTVLGAGRTISGYLAADQQALPTDLRRALHPLRQCPALPIPAYLVVALWMH